uniref:RING-type E3 ubiquitin transferase n=1 Tax=Arcella intermedia TaxID=1963864 RepID=A0A6B2L1Y5_9EUKA
MSLGGGPQLMPFSAQEGTVFMNLKNNPSSLDGVHLVEGKLLVLDGTYSNSKDYRYKLEGIYIWEKGLLFLVGNPLPISYTVVQDYAISLKNLSEIDYKVIESEEVFRNMGEYLERNMEEAQKELLCYFKVWVSFEKNVDQSIRQKDNGYYTIDKPFQKLSGSLISPNCNFSLVLEAETVLVEHYYWKVTTYVLLITVVTSIQVLIFLHQIRITTSITALSKLSPYCIGMQALLDGYICLGHLSAAIYSEKLFHVFSVVAFVYLVLFSFFELGFMVQAWKANNPELVRGGWQSTQQHITTLYGKYYCVLGVCIIFSQMWINNMFFYVFVFVAHSFWVPQIFHNAIHNCHKSYKNQYIFGTSTCRLFLLLYLLGCPENFLQREPSYVFLLGLVLWVYLQCFILYFQDTSPQFLVPEAFLPTKYNYHRPVVFTPGEDHLCPICRAEVHQNDYVVTPCEHYFHQNCLHQWMDVKLECPTCRTVLPVLHDLV